MGSVKQADIDYVTRACDALLTNAKLVKLGWCSSDTHSRYGSLISMLEDVSALQQKLIKMMGDVYVSEGSGR